jgi:predicted RNA-binding protein with PIN domain
MAYLIDGNNLLGHLFPGHFRDPGRRADLIGMLQGFQRQTRARVVLVFDGAAPAGLPDFGREKFAVVFPSEGEPADAAIFDHIERLRDRRHLVVVSTDREIRDFARASGATPRTAEEFHREMKRVLRERRAARELDKADESVSRLEVDLWTRAFTKRP